MTDRTIAGILFLAMHSLRTSYFYPLVGGMHEPAIALATQKYDFFRLSDGVIVFFACFTPTSVLTVRSQLECRSHGEYVYYKIFHSVPG